MMNQSNTFKENKESAELNSGIESTTGDRQDGERPRRPYNSDRPRKFSGPGGPRRHFKRRVCQFCAQKTQPDYKEADSFRKFTTEKGKILPGRITGVCASHQRSLAIEIKRARYLALVAFVRD